MEAIVKINSFDIMQTVFISDHKKVTGFTPCYIKLLEIPDFLMTLEDLTDVHIFGSENYINKIVEATKKKEYTKYNENKITFYINK